MLANRIMMGTYKGGTEPSGFRPDIGIAPKVTVTMIALSHKTPVIDADSIKAAPGAITVTMMPLTFVEPVVEKDSIKVAPGLITVNLRS